MGPVDLYLAAEAVSNGYILVIWSRFRLFWVLEAARDKTKETIVGIQVAYDIYKHRRSVFLTQTEPVGLFLAVWTVSNGYIFVISPILGPEGR